MLLVIERERERGGGWGGVLFLLLKHEDDG